MKFVVSIGIKSGKCGLALQCERYLPAKKQIRKYMRVYDVLKHPLSVQHILTRGLP